VQILAGWRMFTVGPVVALFPRAPVGDHAKEGP
jgi:hypothetical protein